MTFSAVPGAALAAPSNIELGTVSAVPGALPTFEGVLWIGPWAPPDPARLYVGASSTYWSTVYASALYYVPTAAASTMANATPDWYVFT